MSDRPESPTDRHWNERAASVANDAEVNVMDVFQRDLELEHVLPFLDAAIRLVGGFGQTLSQHAGFCGSGGSGHLPLHAGQPAGAPAVGHTVRHAGFFGSNANSSQVASGSGTAASLGGSGISTLDRSIAIAP